MVLDQVGLKGQCLRLTVGDEELDLADLAHHQGDARGMAMAAPALEVAADPVAQHLGLPDVEDSILRIAHQIAARLGRDPLRRAFSRDGSCRSGFNRRTANQWCSVPRSSIAMENSALDLANKDGVIAVGHLADQFTFDAAQGVIEDRQPQFTEAEGAHQRPPTPF